MYRRSLACAALLLLALLAAAGTASADPGDLPTLSGNPPANTERFWFDDHSVVGDDHLSWSDQGGPYYTNSSGQTSQREPQAIRSDTRLDVGGPGSLEVCGYPSGTVGWMRAYQATPGDLTAGTCPAAPTGQPFGWFRYVFGRHSQTHAYDRWHLMDLERFALVPVPGGGADGSPTVWDSHWGTCLGLLSVSLGCDGDENATRLDAGVRTGTSTTTQTDDIDAQVIPIPVSLHDDLRNGAYQLVTLTNPYGLVKEAGTTYGSVSCVTVNLTIGVTGYSEVAVTVTNDHPTTCLRPATLDPALTGPGGFDPMQGAEAVPGCVFTGSHCWPPSADPEHPAPTTGDFIAARSLATGDPAVTPTVLVTQGGAIGTQAATTPDPGTKPSGGAPTTPHQPVTVAPVPPVTQTPTPKPKTAPAPTATSRAKTALRKVFGTGLSGLAVRCTGSTCTVSWRKAGARASGHVYLRTRGGKAEYRVDVTRRKGTRTTHVRRGWRAL